MLAIPLSLLFPLVSAAAAPAEPAAAAPAEPPAAESPAQVAEARDVAVDARRRRLQIGGMSVLLGWAGANILTGIAGNIATSADNPLRYAHQMNWAWNTVNLTLGAVGLRSALREGPLRGSALPRSIVRTRRIFAINALADVGYMLGGYLTWELGKDHESARLRGYGASVILQGAFLMAFDLGMVAVHERNRRRLGLAVVPLAGPVQGAALAGRF
ncbi:MAG: hypothetical protein IPK80_16475 [Nannocystis sp.]|nr:hypothetical protein [Nannocystis sp.]